MKAIMLTVLEVLAFVFVPVPIGSLACKLLGVVPDEGAILGLWIIGMVIIIVSLIAMLAIYYLTKLNRELFKNIERTR